MSASRRSLTLDAYIAKAFIPTFIVAMLFFVLMLEMADLFISIVQYVQNDAPLSSIARSMVLYLPKCMTYALPVATLFSVSYTLGTMYANNELIVIFGSGVPLASFVAPLVLMAMALSVGFFFFDDKLVIPSLAAKKELSKVMLKTGVPTGAADVTILGAGRKIVWNTRYFDHKSSMMTGITLVERDADGRFLSRLNAQSAIWTGTVWRFTGVRRFFWKGDSLVDESYGTWEDEAFSEQPDSFKGGGKPIDEMSVSDAAYHIQFLKRTGLPRAAQTAEFLRRFAFALTPLIVTLLSAALVGRFKKNVLLMSLLISLIAATLYYVTQMISMLLAKSEAIPPAAGAFAPLILFTALIVVLFNMRSA